MKIISLQAENIKRLVAVNITPEGNMVQLTGKNAQGKTSVLDAIWLALKVADVNMDQPVRAGQERGRIRLDMGDLIVTRKFRVDDKGETSTSLLVQAPDGATYTKTPQAMLDGLLSSLTFDPLEFSRMDGAAQVKAVRSLLPGVDFDAVATANRIDYDARREVNRKVADLEGELRAAQSAAPATAPSRVDKTALVDQLTQCSMFNSDIEKRKANRVSAGETIESNVLRLADIAAEIEKLEEEKAALVADCAKWKKALADAPPLPEPRDAAALAAQINAADAINAKADAFDKAVALAITLQARKAESEALTKKMEDRDATLKARIEEAKLPVKGLAFGPDSILLNGIPFSQASDAEKLRTSIAIAMSLNPKLRVIRVRDGSLLDSDGLAMLEQMAKDEDYQVWIERVADGSDVGFVLEDGHVKGQVLNSRSIPEMIAGRKDEIKRTVDLTAAVESGSSMATPAIIASPEVKKRKKAAEPVAATAQSQLL